MNTDRKQEQVWGACPLLALFAFHLCSSVFICANSSSGRAAVRDPIDEFMRFNRPFARRNPELLRLKVARMADGPFAFFRGTFHLFARDVIETKAGPLPLLSGGG